MSHFLAARDTDCKHKFSLTRLIYFSYLSDGLTNTHTRSMALDPYLPCDVPRQSDGSTQIPTLPCSAIGEPGEQCREDRCGLRGCGRDSLFSGSFHIIYWSKNRRLIAGLTFSKVPSWHARSSMFLRCSARECLARGLFAELSRIFPGFWIRVDFSIPPR